jgi:hypothetical protein
VKRRLPRASHLAVAISLVALFAAAGGPAWAKKQVAKISGSSIKSGSITAKQLKDGAVTKAKLAKSVQAGIVGKQGPQGVRGLTGTRGPAGAFNVTDNTGARLGLYAGMLAGSYIGVRLDSGAILAYDNNPPTTFPIPLGGSVVYFAATGCTGQAYVLINPSVPAQVGTMTDSPPSAGSDVWMATQGSTPLGSVAYQSVRSSGGCSNSSSTASNVIAATKAGKVPAITKPLFLTPAS